METNIKTNTVTDSFEAVATKVSLVSIVVNLILSLFKLLAGFLAHSGAMISDAVHSASDVFSSIIVIIGVRIAAKDSDVHHPYGHDRFECAAAIVLSVILLITGIFIGIDAIETIAAGKYDELSVPGILALIAAVISIISKEAMFWYTRHYAVSYNSGALMADAWHHRSDAFSSIGSFIGIVGSRMGFPILDPIASLVICFFIGKAACDIFKDAIEKMVDHSCDIETEAAIRNCAANLNGVLNVDLIHTREFGSKIYVDMEISVDGQKSLFDGHAIAEDVHDAIEMQFPKVKHIMIHVNPLES